MSNYDAALDVFDSDEECIRYVVEEKFGETVKEVKELRGTDVGYVYEVVTKAGRKYQCRADYNKDVMEIRDL